MCGGPRNALTWQCGMITFIEKFREATGLRIEQRLAGVVADGSPAAEAAMRKIFPRLRLLRDIRHRMMAVRRVSRPVEICFRRANLEL